MTDIATIQGYLDQAANGEFVTIPPGAYAIDAPLTLRFNAQVEAAGFQANGVTLKSSILAGQSVLKITVAPGKYIRACCFYGLRIQGSGTEGHGLQIDCTGTSVVSGDFYNFVFRDWMIEGCGGDGVNALGNVFEGLFDNMRPRNNKGNGMTLGNGPSNAGIMSSITCRSGSYGQNGGFGAALVNNAYDVAFEDVYFLENGKAGLYCPNGVIRVQGGGFENNQQNGSGPAVQGANFGTFIGCTEGGNNGKQTSMLGGFYLLQELELMSVRAGSGFGTITNAGVIHMTSCSGTISTTGGVRIQ